MNNVHTGISEYIPIVFDEEHYCLVNTTFHTLLFGIIIYISLFNALFLNNFSQDFQFKTSPIEKKTIQIIDLEHLDQKENNPQIEPQLKAFQIPPKTFHELLEKITFCKIRKKKKLSLITFCEVKDEDINRFYNLYLKTLKSSYESVGKHLDGFLQKMSPEKLKKLVNFSV